MPESRFPSLYSSLLHCHVDCDALLPLAQDASKLPCKIPSSLGIVRDVAKSPGMHFCDICKQPIQSFGLRCGVHTCNCQFHMHCWIMHWNSFFYEVVFFVPISGTRSPVETILPHRRHLQPCPHQPPTPHSFPPLPPILPNPLISLLYPLPLPFTSQHPFCPHSTFPFSASLPTFSKTPNPFPSPPPSNSASNPITSFTVSRLPRSGSSPTRPPPFPSTPQTLSPRSCTFWTLSNAL